MRTWVATRCKLIRNGAMRSQMTGKPGAFGVQQLENSYYSVFARDYQVQYTEYPLSDIASIGGVWSCYLSRPLLIRWNLRRGYSNTHINRQTLHSRMAEDSLSA
jgi:hypothetical protein